MWKQFLWQENSILSQCLILICLPKTKNSLVLQQCFYIMLFLHVSLAILMCFLCQNIYIFRMGRFVMCSLLYFSISSEILVLYLLSGNFVRFSVHLAKLQFLQNVLLKSCVKKQFLFSIYKRKLQTLKPFPEISNAKVYHF